MNQSNKLEDYGKSLDLAQQIEMIKSITMTMDLEYLKACSEKFRDQASWQDSASVLNPSYNPTKSDILRKQAQTMGYLLQFVNGLKECQELKDKAALEDSQRSKIMEMFF